MKYLGDHPDGASFDIVWSYYTYEGSDARLLRTFFLYAIKGNIFYCHHMSLMHEYRRKWAAAGPQKLKRCLDTDEDNHGDEDGVVSFRPANFQADNAELNETIEGIEKLLSNEEGSNSNHSITPFQRMENPAQLDEPMIIGAESEANEETFLQNAQRFPTLFQVIRQGVEEMKMKIGYT